MLTDGRRRSVELGVLLLVHSLHVDRFINLWNVISLVLHWLMVALNNALTVLSLYHDVVFIGLMLNGVKIVLHLGLRNDKLLGSIVRLRNKICVAIYEAKLWVGIGMLRNIQAIGLVACIVVSFNLSMLGMFSASIFFVFELIVNGSLSFNAFRWKQRNSWSSLRRWQESCWLWRSIAVLSFIKYFLGQLLRVNSSSYMLLLSVSITVLHFSLI